MKRLVTIADINGIIVSHLANQLPYMEIGVLLVLAMCGVFIPEEGVISDLLFIHKPSLTGYRTLASLHSHARYWQAIQATLCVLPEHSINSLCCCSIHDRIGCSGV